MPSSVACEIPDFRAEQYIDSTKARRYDPSILFGVAAAKLAVKDAGIDINRIDHDRAGVVEGTASAALHHTLRSAVEFEKKGWKAIQPSHNINAFPGGGSGEIALELQLRAQATTISTACSAGNDALGYAAQAIKNDLADVMIAGASDAPIEAPSFAMFAQTQAMTRWRGDPTAAMKPFDKHRDGFILGEGAAFMVLEELGHALRRGARIYCEWVAHGQACDAFSPFAVHPEGRGLRRAIEKAMFAANCSRDEIDYINPHASATPQNDPVETAVIASVFGPRARQIAVSATKPVTGHLMGATAAVEAIVCALAIHHQIVPPTANLVDPDPECFLDYVTGGARPRPVRTALNINIGFGGKSSALILRRFQQ
jgi:3-oxoacyl-(acyl-carrier-protein) synthase